VPVSHDLLSNPLNYSEAVEDMLLEGSNVLCICDDPLLGNLTLVTTRGHCDFLINEVLANALIQDLREFLRGESETLVGV
jgi:hypothetical protein